VLQGGDCAESLDDCRPEVITSKLKILLQMSLVLAHGLQRPIVRIGRFAGQYTKPRSSPTETRNGVTLPSYFGDLVNGSEFSERARTPDPALMLRGYQHAALTLNFVRALIDSGFADMHHPEQWDLSFLDHACMRPELRQQYQAMVDELASSLHFVKAVGGETPSEARTEFFTSHEGLNLLYESAQTRLVPRRPGYWDLTTHLPWIGDRSRQLDGAHVEFFRGIGNPVGVKIGADADPEQVVRLIEALNPDDLPGKVALITRMGAGRVRAALPPLLQQVRDSGRRVLWIADPMHGNTQFTAAGIKTRSFDDILFELTAVFDAHRAAGTILGGVHFELTGEDVTECVGGATGLSEHDLQRNYTSPCDPRLNYAQAMEMAFLLARHLRS
jgi:3-deoxy-7-phosphoheptulonate synthase